MRCALVRGVGKVGGSADGCVVDGDGCMISVAPESSDEPESEPMLTGGG